jgi:hypothetical protein
MTLQPSDLDDAEAIALLQPFVDGELADAERELVALEIADNPAYQAFVREQQEVRAALRTLARETAPPELRARILAELDVVALESRRGRFAPVLGRLRSFGRGAMLMVPAAAAAAVLFFVTRDAGWMAPELDGSHIEGGMTSGGLARVEQAKPMAPEPAPAPTEPTRSAEPAPESDASLPSGEQLADNLGFAVQVAPAQSLPEGVALVTDSAAVPGSSATVRYGVGGSAVVVDRQWRAGVVRLHGARQVFRGHDYYLARDNHGRPRVGFQLGSVQHELVLEGALSSGDMGVGVDEPDFQLLLSVADALRQAHG